MNHHELLEVFTTIDKNSDGLISVTEY